MTRLLARIPTWLLTLAAGVGIFWCAFLLVAAGVPSMDSRRVVVLATFTHDPSAGSLPWRVALSDPSSPLEHGRVQAFLKWQRRSNLGFPLPIFTKRFELCLGGDAPGGVTPLSVDDAQSLLQTAFATLPAGADERQIAARSVFFGAIAPASARDELIGSALLIDLSLPVAAVGALVSLRELRRRQPKPEACAEPAA